MQTGICTHLTMAPETRALLGQAQVALLLEAVALVVVGYAAYTVVVQLIVDKRRTKPRPHPVTAETDAPPAPVPVPVLSAATVAPTATPAPTATTVPTATPVDDEDDPCMLLSIECLGNPWQPKWNVKKFGPKKNCKDCYRECKFHSKPLGTWPDYKCPRH